MPQSSKSSREERRTVMDIPIDERFTVRRRGLSVRSMKKLQGHADVLRDVLSRSRETSEEMITILSTFDERLTTLETAMRPIQKKTLAFRQAHSNIDATIKTVEAVLEKFDIPQQVEQRIKDGPRRDLDAYLQAVDKLREGIAFFEAKPQYKSSGSALAASKGLMKEAMQMLEADFHQLLQNNSKAMDPAKLYEAMPELSGDETPEAVDGNAADVAGGNATEAAAAAGEVQRKPLPPLLLPTLVERLNAVAQRMIRNGAAAACTRVYREVRGNTMEASMRRLGVEMVTKEDLQRMPWEELENRIGSWIQYIKIAMAVIFPEERKLCYEVFKNLDPHREICFAELADRALTMLLSFGEAIAAGQKSPEKLFVLLDMYETIRDIMPVAVESLPGNACIPCREYLRSLQHSLADISRKTFSEFEDAVERDSTKTPVADGTVHPLTSYVINYVKFLFDYEGTLRQLFEEAEKEKIPAGARPSGRPRLEVATLQIMRVLEGNLEAKSKLYKDLALTHLFLMNNKNYIVRSIRKSEQARLLVGEDWLITHRKLVQQHQATYQKLAWSKVQAVVLPTNEPINKSTLKDKLKQFNLALEEQHAKQVIWTIPDPEQQKAVKRAIADQIVPPYKDFLKRFGSLLDGLKNQSKHFKYKPEDVERMIGDLFEGKALLAEQQKAKGFGMH